MIDNVQNSQMAHGMGKTALPHPDPANKPAADGSDAYAQVTFADLINQAMQEPATETDAVQKGTGATPIRPTYEPPEHSLRRPEHRNLRYLKTLQLDRSSPRGAYHGW